MLSCEKDQIKGWSVLVQMLIWQVEFSVCAGCYACSLLCLCVGLYISRYGEKTLLIFQTKPSSSSVSFRDTAEFLRPCKKASKTLFYKVVLGLQQHLQAVQLTLQFLSLNWSLTGRQQKVVPVMKTFPADDEGGVHAIFRMWVWLGDLQAHAGQQLCRSGIWGCSQHWSISEWAALGLGQLKGAVATLASSLTGSTENDHSSKASFLATCKDFGACNQYFRNPHSCLFTSGFG